MLRNVSVIDNFLDRETFEGIQSTITNNNGHNFPWFISKIFYDGANNILENKMGDNTFNYMMSHSFYSNSTPQSNYFEMMSPILDKLDIVSLIRVKANLYFAAGNQYIHGYHTDNTLKNCTTCIYFINKNNGKLFFEDKPAVDAVDNRIVIFDSQTVHSSSTCTDEKIRCTININYIDKRGLI